MSRRTFSRSRRTTPRRKMVWARHTNVDNLEVLTSPETAPPSATDLLAPFRTEMGSQLIGVTVARIRGIMGVHTLAPSPALTFVRAAIRICDQADLERAPGNIDSPFDENSAYLDWMAWEPFVAPENAEHRPAQTVQRVVDMKSSRKLEELNQSLGLFVGTRTAAGDQVSPITFWSNLSILLMLP